MTKQIAAIDLGSNSFYLATATIEQGGLGATNRLRHRVRLGKSIPTTRNIDAISMDKGVQALTDFQKHLQQNNIQHLLVAGTAALRDAENANVFIDRAQQILHTPVQVLSGDQEAEMILAGVRLRRHHDFSQHDNLVIDIGGCSSELAIGNQQQDKFLTSVPTGVLSWLPQFKQLSWSVTDYLNLVQAIEHDIAEECQRTKAQGYSKAFATSGCWQVIDDVRNHLGLLEINRECLADIRRWAYAHASHQKLLQLDVSIERLDILPLALALAEAFFNQLELQHLHYCEANLQDGLLSQVYSQHLNR